jgi:hypothetical protein
LLSFQRGARRPRKVRESPRVVETQKIRVDPRPVETQEDPR